jgi:hypothetical protein
MLLLAGEEAAEIRELPGHELHETAERDNAFQGTALVDDRQPADAEGTASS